MSRYVFYNGFEQTTLPEPKFEKQVVAKEENEKYYVRLLHGDIINPNNVDLNTMLKTPPNFMKVKKLFWEEYVAFITKKKIVLFTRLQRSLLDNKEK
jgi:hypothetical protein